MQLGGVVLGLTAGILVARHNKEWLAESPFRVTSIWLGYFVATVGGYVTGTLVARRLC